jgi:hypothetical protein
MILKFFTSRVTSKAVHGAPQHAREVVKFLADIEAGLLGRLYARFEEAIQATAGELAPWYVVPADQVVHRLVVLALLRSWTTRT